MADIQQQLESFHEVVKLNRFAENATLREKRDAVLKKLEERLPAAFKAHGEEVPEYYTKNQGSYEMGTGNAPLSRDFDIDQGVYFNVSRSDYPDPVALKERVYEALKGHTDDQMIRRPCVTVWYHRNGERIYHVDLAIYADETSRLFGRAYIAIGREHSLAENRYWEVSDPQGFIDKINRRFKGPDRAQFRRVVRYLKRWKDENFPSDGNAAPLGVGLTAAAFHWMNNACFDQASDQPNDLMALRGLVQSMLDHFSWFDSRLVVKMPVEPYNDLFEDMSARQQENFKERLTILRDALGKAEDAADLHRACTFLQGVFGDDFPIPPKGAVEKDKTLPTVSRSIARPLFGVGGVLLLLRILSGRR